MYRCVSHVCLVPTKVREGIGSPGTVVMYCCGCLELKLGLLEKQPVLLTSEPISPLWAMYSDGDTSAAGKLGTCILCT